MRIRILREVTLTHPDSWKMQYTSRARPPDKMSASPRKEKRNVYNHRPGCTGVCRRPGRPDHPPRTAAKPYASRCDWRWNQRGNDPGRLYPFQPRGAAANFYRPYCVAWTARPVDWHFRSPSQCKNQQVNPHGSEHTLKHMLKRMLCHMFNHMVCHTARTVGCAFTRTTRRS